MNSRDVHTPKIAKSLMLRFLSFDYRKNIVGDFEEEYLYILGNKGKFSAHVWYWFQLFKSLPSFVNNSIYWSAAMLKSYIITASRTFRKNKVNSLINLSGFSIGIASCLLIYSFVTYEFSFDSFHKDADRVYMMTLVKDNIGTNLGSEIQPNLGPALKNDSNEVEEFSRFLSFSSTVKSIDSNRLVFREWLHFADTGFLNIFSFNYQPRVESDIFENDQSIIISDRMAEKYFPGEEAIDKQLAIEVGGEFKTFIVRSVVQDIPENSSISFDFLLPFSLMREVMTEERYTSWNFYWGNLFVKVSEGTQTGDLRAAIPNLADTYGMRKLFQFSSSIAGGRFTGAVEPVPFKEYHFSDRIESSSYLQQKSNPLYSYILSGIGALILAIACINFMNLSISQSMKRAKEIGVRKVMGAFRYQLIKQFYAESFLMVFMAVVLGAGMAELLEPFFRELTGKPVAINNFESIGAVFLLFGFVAGIGFLAGTYPAMFLSGFKPVKILKDGFKANDSNIFTRTLVIFQFSVSVFLVIGALNMSAQLDFMLSRDLGYDSDNVVMVTTWDKESSQILSRLKNEVTKYPEVENVSMVSGGGFHNNNVGFNIVSSGGKRFEYQTINADENFLETMKIELLQGRNFSPDNPSDPHNSVLVNETLINTYDFHSPIGAPLAMHRRENIKIIGVVKDFNFKSLHNKVQPLIISMFPDRTYRSIYIKTRTAEVAGLLEKIKDVWPRIAPDADVLYQFLDEEKLKLYTQEQNWRTIISSAMFFAIFIACLGLYGMSSLMAANRTKEFGIRKVLGASISGLLVNFNKQFVKLIVISNIIAWPLAYIAVGKWLENFAFRVDLNISIYFMAAGFCLGVTMITISIHAFKVSSNNPVDSLKYE